MRGLSFVASTIFHKFGFTDDVLKDLLIIRPQNEDKFTATLPMFVK